MRLTSFQFALSKQFLPAFKIMPVIVALADKIRYYCRSWTQEKWSRLHILEATTLMLLGLSSAWGNAIHFSISECFPSLQLNKYEYLWVTKVPIITNINFFCRSPGMSISRLMFNFFENDVIASFLFGKNAIILEFDSAYILLYLTYFCGM